jgi:hypothetical protein
MEVDVGRRVERKSWFAILALKLVLLSEMVHIDTLNIHDIQTLVNQNFRSSFTSTKLLLYHISRPHPRLQR